jgi:DNA replication protein DnaC
MDTLNHLNASQVDHSLDASFRSTLNLHFWIIDEIGLAALDQKTSICFTRSSRPARARNAAPSLPPNTVFSEWGNILYNATIATAIVDRLIENTEIFLLGRDSVGKGKTPPTSPAAE